MHNSSPFPAFAIIAASLLVTAASAFAVDSDGIEARYRSERAACLSGQTGQERTACLKEASAARAEARRHRLENGQGNFDKNAMIRCNALPAADKSDCMLRMQGEGKVTGSVRDGGVYRELTTTIPGDASK